MNFIAHAESSVNLLTLARRVAKFNVPVMITGETGTGKECVAKYIHAHAFDLDAPYIGVNCAAIPENMLEAILFGYEKGAFTGAISSQPGKFEQANGGTLLLDEIGDMPLALQVKLLRVLQEQEVERLGSQKRIKLDIRLIASTNKNLEVEIAEGRFRQDLFYRLSVVPMHIEPLRDRVEDIVPLAELFIRKYKSFSTEKPCLTPEARRYLQSYNWPGNVRELENVVQRGLIMSTDGALEAGCFGIKPTPDSAMITLPDNAEPVACSENRPIKQRGRMAEFQYILDLLRRYQGNKSKTAEFLGITPRALRYRLASMRQQGVDPGFIPKCLYQEMEFMIDKLAASSLATGQTGMLTEMARLRAQATQGSASPLPAEHPMASLSMPSFGSVIDGAIRHVDNQQKVAAEQQRAIEMGTSDDLTSAMLESQKASVVFSAMMQVRNKLTTAFDDVMNISM